MGKKGDLSDPECVVVVAVRQAGLSVSETVDLWGFSQTTISSVYRGWYEKRKYQVSGRSVGENAVLMPEVREGRSHQLKTIERQQ